MPRELRFPYMAWAHAEAVRSKHCLTQSGMPRPADELFRDVPGLDLGHPSAEALPELTRRLAELFGLPPERVLVTLGASGGMHLCALRWMGAGNRVVTDLPSYEPFRALPALLGAELRIVERTLERAWRFDLEQVEGELARGAGPGHVFLANPHNPTGAVLSAGELKALASAAERAGGVLVSCEVYMEMARPEQRVHAFALAPNGVSIGSLTKAYGLGPLRIGWILLGEGLAEEAEALRDLSYLSYVDPPTAALRGGIAALERLPELTAPLRRVERESRPILERWLAQSARVESTLPAIGIVAFPRVRGVTDTLALQRWLAHEHEIDVVPGEFFGRPGHLRVGCGVPPATLATALERLEAALVAYRA